MERSWLAVPVGVVAGVAVATLAPLPAGQARILGITAFCIALWIGNPVPPWFTGLLCVGLIGVGFSPDRAVTGFASPATWLIAFGLIIGEATRRSGLAAALQALALSRVAGGDPDAGTAYRRLLVLLSAAALGFTFLLPSVLVRVLILAPILAEIGTAFEDRDARLGVFFAPLFVTFYSSVGVLTANLPNIIITGIVDSVAGVSITWSQWFLAVFPVMGLGRSVLIVAVVYALYRPSPGSGVSLPAEQAATDPRARRTFGFLLVGVAVWATDFLHGLHPIFGALAVAVLVVLPRVGTMDLDAVGEVDFSILFFVGAVFAIADVLTSTGFTDVAAEGLLAFVPADAPLPLTLLAVFGATLALVFVLEGVAVSSVLTPIVVSFAVEAGLPVAPVAYTEAIALSVYFFPYQSMVLVVMIRQDLVEPTEVIRMATVLSVATVLAVLPLQLGYFTLL